MKKRKDKINKKKEYEAHNIVLYNAQLVLQHPVKSQ